jgi:hypothetical protein
MTGTADLESAWLAEPAARALYRAVRAACGSSGGEFADRVDAGLAAALSFLAEDPDLNRDLVVLGGDVETLAAQRRWMANFGELLRAATAGLPDLSGSRFREPFMIESIRFQIGRKVLVGEAARLPELRPELFRVVLAHYRAAEPVREAPAGRASVLMSRYEARSK